MDDFNEEEFIRKLITVLKNITGRNGKFIDNNYLEKFLSNLRNECDSHSKYEKYLKLPEVLEWLTEDVNIASKTLTYQTITFVIQFLGIIMKNEDGFKSVQKTTLLDQIKEKLIVEKQNNYTLKIIFMKFLNDIVSHQSGCEWVFHQKIWKIVNSWFFSNHNFYIEQECLAFYKKLFKRIVPLDGLLEEIFYDITLTLKANENFINNFMEVTKPLKLLTGILRLFVLDHCDVGQAKLSEMFNFKKELDFILKKCNKEDTLEVASILYVLYEILKLGDKSKVLVMSQVLPVVLDVFTLLLQKNQINCIVKVSKFCQILWNEMRNNSSFENSVEVNFIILQLIPMYALKIDSESKTLDSNVQKLFDMTDENTQKFISAFKEKIKNKSETQKWALQGLHSVIENLDCLKKAEATVIFQFLAYVLWSLVSVSQNFHLMAYQADQNSEDIHLLSSILNSLCFLLKKFEINWTHCVENLSFFKIACDLLDNASTSSLLIVQILSFVKLVVSHFKDPFFFKQYETLNLPKLLSLLHKHIHDPNWEIRDSCLEVIIAMIELPESKHYFLQNLLVEKDLFSLLYRMVEGDSESYVRASGLKALSAAIKIESFKPLVSDMNLPVKIFSLFQEESEGIVRGEAILLLTQMYLNMNMKPELLSSLYEIMGYAALLDLHWEVKVNSLAFWETVMRRIFADENIIDSSFQNDVLNKNVVVISDNEMKVKLGKALEELSNNGCLHVLMSTLHDDCDFQVVQKSAEILTELLTLLKRFNVTEMIQNFSVCNMISFKRKLEGADSIESERKSVCKERENEIKDDKNVINECVKTNSEIVIEEIVNEMDINLLVSVHRREKINRAPEPNKKVKLEKIKPEVFLRQMQNFESQSFLTDKKKWLVNADPDLQSLINDILIINSVSETNIMDCY